MSPEEVEHRGHVHRLPVRQPQRDHARFRSRARSPGGTQGTWRRGEHCLHGVVELPDAGEPARERDVGDRQVGRLEQHPRGLGALRAGQGDRPGAHLGHQGAMHLTLGVAQAASQSGHALTVDRAVGDESKRPPSQVAADVPLRRTGRGVRPASLARAIAGALRSGGTRMKRHVRAVRCDRRAGRAAVDAGGAHRGEEPPVEAGVTSLAPPGSRCRSRGAARGPVCQGREASTRGFRT